MKRRTAILAMGVAIASSSLLYAQGEANSLPSAKEVIAKFVKATGGAEAYKKLKSRRIVGKMEIKKVGVSGKLTVVTGSGGKSYVEADIEGVGKELAGSDGETYWSKSAFTGTRIIEKEEKQRQVIESDLQSVLHQDKYYKDMKVTGIEKINDEDHYRLEKVNKVTGDKQVDFYSVKTGLSSKSVIPMATPLGKMSIEIVVDDYRKVGDLLMSHKSTQTLPGNMIQELTFEKVELNGKLDPAMFELPEEVAKLKQKADEKKASAAKESEPEPVGAQ